MASLPALLIALDLGATASSIRQFVFTPTHGSWLNQVEGFFSKLARSVLRHIRVESKQELKDRIMAAMDEFNRAPRRPYLVLQARPGRLI
jgi:transposase